MSFILSTKKPNIVEIIQNFSTMPLFDLDLHCLLIAPLRVSLIPPVKCHKLEYLDL